MFSKIKSKLKEKAMPIIAGISTVLGSVQPIHAVTVPNVTINTAISADTIFSALIGVILTIATYMGIALSAYGAFQFVMAFRDENPEGKTKGMTTILTGVFLLSLSIVFSAMGIIS